MRTRALIAVAIGVGLSISGFLLGEWQVRRGAAKSALQAQWDGALREPPRRLRAADFSEVGQRLPMRVQLTGRFDPAALVWLDNRPHEGRIGRLALMPLQLEDGARVLVQRGWSPIDPRDRTRLPDLPTPRGTVELEGIAMAQPPRVLELGDEDKAASALPAIWQNLDYARFERAAGIGLPRFTVQQISALEDGLVRSVPRFDAGVERHRGYAFQWYSLAALTAGLTLYFGWRGWRAGKGDRR